VVDLLQDALVLAPRRASGCPTEDHHDRVVFVGEFVVAAVFCGSDFGDVLGLILPTEVTFHEVSIFHGMLD
jgi:hypothetical protein